MSRCPANDEILDLLDEKLAPAAVDAVEDHLETCASCRRRVEALANGETAAGPGVSRLSPALGVRFRGALDHLGDWLLPSIAVEAGACLGIQVPDCVGLPADLPGFTELCEVGRGGMGIVYRARQRGLERPVALKVISEGRTASPGARERFRREALALARLRHPNVVRIYGVGEYEGLSFLVMEWVEGGDLAQRLRRGLFPPREVAALALPLALALQTAHEQGIIHRDLKPSNILLADVSSGSSDQARPSSSSGLEPKVSDFGLAKLLEDDAGATVSGAAIGTPYYMAPEQTGLLGSTAQGPATDVYGLGAILYEMLVGRPPFEGRTRHETILQVVTSQVISPRRLRSLVPRDLETICLKCLERDPSRRYATAGALADDLVRFLDGRPIQSRRVGGLERGVRWCRRNPTVAGLVTALAAVFLAGFAAVTVQWRRADAEATRANATARAEAEARGAESRLRIEAQSAIAERDFDRGWELARQGEADQGQLWMAEALRQAPAERPELARMARANLAAWRTQAVPLRAILDHRAAVHHAAFRPDGGAVLTASADGTAQVWDASTGQPLGPALEHGDKVYCVAFSPDGRLALTGGYEGKARLWDAATGRRVGPAVVHGKVIWTLAFSPDGRRFMTHGNDRTARLWETASGRSAGLAVARGAMANPCFSPDGRLLLTGGPDGLARLWDTTSGQPVGANMRHGGQLKCASFSPDGRRLVTGGTNGVARIWNATSGEPMGPPLRHGAVVCRALFSPDGRLVLTGSPVGTARLWDAATGRPIGPLLRHGDEIKQASFSPDGRMILTCSLDHTARLWDVATGRPVGSPLRHRLAVTVAAFSPDGRRILTAGDDGVAKLWDFGPGAIGSDAPMIPYRLADDRGDTDAPEAGIRFDAAVFSPDRTRVLLGSTGDGLARLVESATGQPFGPPMKHRWPSVVAVAFSPDGQRIATSSCERGFQEGGGPSNMCQIWDADTARPVSPLLLHSDWASVLAFRPDGKVLASGDYGSAVHFWDVETGASLGPPLRAGSIVLSLAFSPDGRMLAVGTADLVHQVELWDLAAGKRRGEPIPFKHHVVALAFSPDGAHLAAGSIDSTVRLVEVATGRAIGEPLCHADRVCGLSFSPDARLLLTVNAGPPGTSAARLWNVATGAPASPVLTHAGTIAAGAVAFSPDGTLFVTGCEDGSIHCWDVGTARPIGPPRMLRGPVRGLAFGRDGQRVLAVDNRGEVGTWAVPGHPDEPARRLVEQLAARSGLGLDAGREVTVLDTASWRQCVDACGSTARAPQSTDEKRAWHDLCARDAEAVGDSFAARWHLVRLIGVQPGDGLARARHAVALLLAGDAQAAEAELDRALDLGPRGRILDWLSQRAENLRAGGRPRDSLRLLERLGAARPADWRLSALRAEVLGALGLIALREAELARAVDQGATIPFLIRLASERGRDGRWPSAAKLYDRAIALGTVPHEVWQQAAVAHLEIDDEAGFQAICRTMRDRHPAAVLERTVATTLANVCTLGPEGAGHDGKARTWLGDLPVGPPCGPKGWKHEFRGTLGALDYRSGRYRDAIDRIEQAIVTGDGDSGFEDGAFLAMAYHASGDDAKARAILAGPATFEPDSRPEEFFNNRARLLLRREAKRMIFDRQFPADPFAR